MNVEKNKLDYRFINFERPDPKTWLLYLDNKWKNENIETKISINKESHINNNYWQVEISKIINSLSFRRLQYKTQIFMNPTLDHYSDRMRHTLSVMEISMQLSNKFGLNEKLTQAIALAHDIGHSPFGHAGERTLNQLILKHSNKKRLFDHVVQGARVLIYLEYDSRFAQPISERINEKYGINPSLSVVYGILNHSESYLKEIKENNNIDRWWDLEELIKNNIKKRLYEADCVKVADKISQCVNDLADAYQTHIISKEDLNYIFEKKIKYPSQYGYELEEHLIESIEKDKNGIRYNSDGKCIIEKYKKIRKEKIFDSPAIIFADNKASNIITDLFNHFIEEEKIMKQIKKKKKNDIIHKIPHSIYEIEWLFGLPWDRIVINYIASMTDRYAENLHRKLFN